MYQGVEHDGAFVNETSINVYEFTTLRTKQKATDDATKVAKLIRHLLSAPENRYKPATGFFVTQEEPTADQRQAVAAVAQREGLTIHALSFLSLQKSIVDVERYIALRQNAPFGSSAAHLAATPRQTTRSYVPPTLFIPSLDTEVTGLKQIVERTCAGENTVLLGDFGVGKSAALREIFAALRKAYFRAPQKNRFPIHINLRDCIGLRSPSEIFQRHAEELGFTGAAGLVSSWRAGQADLILDGFDELVPTRWVGSPRDLRSIRRHALNVVRQMVADTPNDSSVVICGRAQYFSSLEELTETLGVRDAEAIEIRDFTSDQISAYVGEIDVPDWLPPRPLLLELFARVHEYDPNAARLSERGAGWSYLMRRVAERESERVSSIPADTFEKLISRVALAARTETEGRGPLTLSTMRQAFYEVCGYEAEEEGVQALLRLPGLANTGTTGESESRMFVDPDFADAAFAIELAEYIAAPFVDHPLADRAKWSEASSSLVIDVAGDRLGAAGFSNAVASACASKRISDNLYDAVLHDAVSVAVDMSPDASVSPPPFFADIIVERVQLEPGSGALLHATWSGCVIDILDVAGLIETFPFPTFQNCDIGTISGWGAIPAPLMNSFKDCSVQTFATRVDTTAGLIELDLPAELRVALTILKKVYAQSGSGRRVSALSRGLPLEFRHLVDESIEALQTLGYITLGSGKGETIARPVRQKRASALALLNAPSSALAELHIGERT
ncbi:NACHT domain-containing NTPase [Cellulomonas sp. 179-A 9B4 NHS]|uniref:NACHT domain-containing protein n=1 Tax=Cellulomonas sp. 179-A 9B4 NHS TaxID=3142379 RepID=UPI00399FD995